MIPDFIKEGIEISNPCLRRSGFAQAGQTNPKHQFQITKTAHIWNLAHWKLFGTWCLEFGAYSFNPPSPIWVCQKAPIDS